MNEVISQFEDGGLTVVIYLTGSPETARHSALVLGPDFIRLDEVSPKEFAHIDKVAAERAHHEPPFGRYYAEIYHGMIK